MFLKKGQSLIEILIAISLAGILLPAILTGLITSNEGKPQEIQRIQATSILKSTFEEMRSIRESGWANIATNGTYHPVAISNKWTLAAGTETVNGYTKQVVIANTQRDSNGNIVDNSSYVLPSGQTANACNADVNFDGIVNDTDINLISSHFGEPARPVGTNIFDVNTDGNVNVLDLSFATSKKNSICPIGANDPATKKITITVSWQTPNQSSVTQTEYLSRYLGNDQKTQTTQSDFSTGSIQTNTQVVNNAGGEIQLTRDNSATYGNKFAPDSTNSTALINQSLQYSTRFTAQNTKTVNAVEVYINGATSASATYRFGLQADNAGNPSGTFLGSGTAIVSSVGYQTVSISPSVNINAGTIYHLVVRYETGPVNSNHFFSVLSLSPNMQLYPQTNTPDNNANVLIFQNNSWVQQNYQPVYILDFTDATTEGNPYQFINNIAVYGTTQIGEKFSFSGVDKVVSAISVRVKTTTGLPTDNVYITLEDADLNTQIERGTLATANQVSSSAYNYYTYNFTTQRTLTAGKNYRIYISSPNSTSSTNAYLFPSVQISGPPNLQTKYTAISYDGNTSVYTIKNTAVSQNWSVVYPWDWAGYKFTIQGGFNPSGTFESQSFDAGASAAYNYLSWNAQVPAGSNLKFQIATNNDNANWSYSGPDGTLSTFFNSPGAIPPNRVHGRYLKYRAFFSSDGSSSPTLNDISVNYSP